MSQSQRRKTRKRKTNDSEPSNCEEVVSAPKTSSSNWVPAVLEPAIYSDDPEAEARRNACDFTQKISLEDAKAGRVNRPVRVYADGCYDMFHSGHARQLWQAKNAFPKCQVYLLVGVVSAETTHRCKGQTVMNENERYEMVRHCRYVDEVVKDAPWVTDWQLINRHKIDFVAHDDLPYKQDDTDDVYGWLKEAGIFVATQRTEGISTTDAIARIIRDYDTYVRRNLARGYSAADLNVGYVKAMELRVTDTVGTLRRTGGNMLKYWEDKSVRFVNNFIGAFKQS